MQFTERAQGFRIGSTTFASFPSTKNAALERYNTSPRFLIIISFAAVYLIWGGTYILNYWSLATFPPMFLAGSRFTVAGLVMLPFFTKRMGVVTSKQLLNAVLMGLLMLSLGTGSVVYALQFVDTGLTALTVAFEPAIVVLLMWWILGNPPTMKTMAGVILGIMGMTVLVTQREIITDETTLFGFSLVLIALVSWAVGSIYISKLDMPASKGLSAAIQMLGAGLVLIVFSLAIREDIPQVWLNYDLRAIISWSVLVVFGSIIAYSAFNFLLLHTSPDKVATTTYVNPVIAMILGWSLNNEELSSQSLIAALILLTGVFFINTNKHGIKKT